MTRAVAITQRQIRDVEEIAFNLIRSGVDEGAAKLLGIALAWKVSPVVDDPYIDEPVGMAEVYEIGNYSRKVGS